jgi:hypothetical protein
MFELYQDERRQLGPTYLEALEKGSTRLSNSMLRPRPDRAGAVPVEDDMYRLTSPVRYVAMADADEWLVTEFIELCRVPMWKRWID